MPSILTLEGPPPKKSRKRKAKSSGTECRIGDCKPVFNRRTKRSVQLCCVGKAKSRSGWLFKKK